VDEEVKGAELGTWIVGLGGWGGLSETGARRGFLQTLLVGLACGEVLGLLSGRVLFRHEWYSVQGVHRRFWGIQRDTCAAEFHADAAGGRRV